MKTIIKTIWCILVLAVSASAANYTVKSSGGGNYTTIQACATAMSAGDTCTVYAGTYNERVTLTAGTSGNYKTLTVNPSDSVNALGFTINSHVKVNGFHIQNTSSPGTSCVSIPAGSTDFYITNNIMYACGGVNEGTSSASSHGFIQGNTISYPSTTTGGNNTGPAFTIYGNYHLIENNDISHTSDGFHFAGSHNIVRNNTMHDTLDSQCGANSGNCHIDFIECEPVLASQFNVYEGNTEINNVSANGHGVLVQADACGGNCFNTIMRFNTAAHIGGGMVIDDNATSSSAGYSHIKSYNNTWADVAIQGRAGGVVDNYSHNSTYPSDINNVYYFVGSASDLNAYGADSSVDPTFTYGHSLAFCTGSPCTIHSHLYGSGSFTSDPGNLLTNPLFVNYAGNNFALSTGSPAIGTGRALTAASNSGSGSTSLTVADAAYFQDGYGIAGVQADWIRIGASTTVQIASINYSTNTLTLASPATWSSGTAVFLYKDSSGTVVLTGANPDMGALPSTSTVASNPAPPTGLTAIVQ